MSSSQPQLPDGTFAPGPSVDPTVTRPAGSVPDTQTLLRALTAPTNAPIIGAPGTDKTLAAPPDSTLTPSPDGPSRRPRRTGSRTEGRHGRPSWVATAAGTLANLPRRVVLAAAVVLAVLVIAALLIAKMSSAGQEPTVTPSTAAPQGASLTVGTAKIPALKGSCTGTVCQFPREGQMPQVSAKASAGTLPLTASDPLVGVSAFRVDDPAAAAPFTLAGPQLRFAGAAPGLYQVTLLGTDGASWQLRVQLTK